MTLRPYEGKTFGKWILAGEHAVLRGSPALAFPLLSRSLSLRFSPGSQPLQVGFQGLHASELQLLFWGVLERALEFKGTHISAIQGTMEVDCDLPMGAGLGASAALCAGVGKWCEHQGMLAGEGVYEFSRRLENMFHGESSGVDIAVSLQARGLRFVRGQEFVSLSPKWLPRLYLSYSGQRGVTSECVAKVKEMIRTDLATGERVDQQMREAVRLSEQALQAGAAEGFAILTEALDLARGCFETWGLIPSELQRHLRMLEEAGAIAVKPTGSGGGGYALSLWSEAPPEAIESTLIPLTFN